MKDFLVVAEPYLIVIVMLAFLIAVLAKWHYRSKEDAIVSNGISSQAYLYHIINLKTNSRVAGFVDLNEAWAAVRNYPEGEFRVVDVFGRRL